MPAFIFAWLYGGIQALYIQDMLFYPMDHYNHWMDQFKK